MLLIDGMKTRNEKAEMLAKAKQLRQQAKDHRERGAWIDAYRLENRARILEVKAKHG